jgi:hypothetical protein
VSEIRLHQMVQAVVEAFFLQRVPLQSLKEWDVLALNVREELRAAAGAGARHGQAYQRGSNSSDGAKRAGHGES